MKNSTKLGLNAVVITAVTIAAVILLNAILTVISSKVPMKIDLTREKVYELSANTKEVMKKLDKEIDVYALYPANTGSNEYITYAEEYLDKYSALNKNFKVTFIDPEKNPGFAKKYEEQGQQISTGSIILQCGDRVKTVAFSQMYSTNDYTGSTSIDLEKKLTAAVANVSGQSGDAKIYFTEGHNEDDASELTAALENNGYEHETVNISVSGIPEDAAAIAIVAPSVDFTAEERDALDKYLDNGGKAIFIEQTGTKGLERLNEYLTEWGTAVRGDFVVETDGNKFVNFYNMPAPLPDLAEHDITKNLISQKLLYLAPMSQSIAVNDDNTRRAKITPLLTTSDKSYGKSNLSFTTYDKENGDTDGPLTVAALAEDQSGKGGKILVIGSLAAVETQGILEEASYANGDFILNAVGYMTESNNSMDIRAKEITASKLNITQTQYVVTYVLIQYLLPLLIIAAGLTVWLKRRYK